MVDIPNTNIVYQYDDELMYDSHGLGSNGSTNDISSSEINPNVNDEHIKNIIDKTSNQSINKGWNNRNELFIISIQLNCKHYKHMHELSYYNYNNIYKIMKVILIVMSTLLTVLTTYPDQYNNILVIFRYILTYIVTLFSILMHFLNYSNLAESHKRSAYEFLKIHHDIKQQMCLYKKDRQVAFKYIAKIVKDYDRLIMNSPAILPYILSKCKHMIENSHDDIQNIVKEISTVNILDPPDTITPTGSTSNVMNTRNLSLNNHDNIDIRVGDSSNQFVANGNQFTTNGSPFVINGDINDDDVNKCNSAQIKELRLRFFKENSTYEYLRFLQNEIGN